MLHKKIKIYNFTSSKCYFTLCFLIDFTIIQYTYNDVLIIACLLLIIITDRLLRIHTLHCRVYSIPKCTGNVVYHFTTTVCPSYEWERINLPSFACNSRDINKCTPINLRTILFVPRKNYIVGSVDRGSRARRRARITLPSKCTRNAR